LDISNCCFATSLLVQERSNNSFRQFFVIWSWYPVTDTLTDHGVYLGITKGKVSYYHFVSFRLFVYHDYCF